MATILVAKIYFHQSSDIVVLQTMPFSDLTLPVLAAAHGRVSSRSGSLVLVLVGREIWHRPSRCSIFTFWLPSVDSTMALLLMVGGGGVQVVSDRLRHGSYCSDGQVRSQCFQ
jgi:hypothetical protein